jgi:hypothetical protein
MTHKPKRERKAKLTDAERFKLFQDRAREVEAFDDPKDFDKAFDKVVTPKKIAPPTKRQPQRPT